MTKSESFKAYSVSEISEVLKACFQNPAFRDIPVYGEVYSIRLGKFSYIELGDQGKKQVNSPLLKCAFSTFYGEDYGLEDIKVGDVVLIRGSLSYYPHGSSVTLWGNSIELLRSQEGKNLLAKKKTLEKLDKLGYLNPERKKKIPAYCKKVAILTAEGGAAYQDILKTLHDRFPVSTVLYPVTVQGPGAAKTIVDAMNKATKGDYDVILLGRGGGSKTDLSCFDDEKVAFAIAESPIPVITCIGHTIDTAIADRVSDVQAITPTEGASLINPSKEEVLERQDNFRRELKEEYLAILEEKKRELASFEDRLVSLSPKALLTQAKEKLIQKDMQRDNLFLSRLKEESNKDSIYLLNLKKSFENQIQAAKERRQKFLTSLAPYNPELIKEKGYALIYKEGKLVKGASQLQASDEVTITYLDGRKEAVIKGETKNGHEKD